MAGEILMEQSMGVQLASDNLSAVLYFNQADEKLAFTAKELEQFIKSHGVVFGIHTDLIERIANDPKSFFYNQTIIATGTPPADGVDGFIRYAYDMDDSRRPLELDNGTVDYKEVIQLRNVKRGQLIAEKVPAQDGRPGKSVTGEILYGRNGKEARFKIGKNVVLNPEQTALYAAIDGMIAKTDRDKINVFPVYEINGDVDYKTGNIDFVGTVVIRGNVLTGFRVRAAGDIRVVGGVEGAELDTDGSVEVTGGILAGNKGLVKAGKNVKCSFIQDANVVAGEDIIVSQSIMHSHVRAGRSIVCAGAKGLLVGGIAQAGEKVTARTIGNTMSTATAIEVGVLPELRTELVELRGKLRGLNESLDKTDKALALLDQLAAAGQLTGDKMALRVKLGATKRQSIDEQRTIKEQILEIEKTLEDTERAKVEAVNTVYGGTKIVIGRYTRFVKEMAQRVYFQYADGDIVMNPMF